MESMLCFGRPADEIVKAVAEAGLDMLVLGSHGHRGLGDVVHGQTVATVRHRVRIPVLVMPANTPEPALRSDKGQPGPSPGRDPMQAT